MRKKRVIGNWKLNGSLQQNAALLKDVVARAQNLNGVELVVCPVAIHIPAAAELLKSSSVSLGAQNLCDQPDGAFTGEISAGMLAEFNCEYAIIGHSERRQIYNESQSVMAEKVSQALSSNITAVYCVGETKEDRESNQTEAVIASQIDPLVQKLGIEAFDKIVIAYEPVWAIGTGLAASAEQAQQVHAYIRDRLKQENSAVADGLSILYGGSVKPANAKELFSQPDIDGGLIGGASLSAQDFIAIAEAAIS